MRFALHIGKPDSRHGLPGFSMVWVHLYLNISCCSCFFLTTDHCPLPAAHYPLPVACCPLPTVSCALRIPYCSFQSIPPNAQKVGISEFRRSTAPVCKLPKIHPPPKEIPRRGPPGIPYLQYRMHFWGPCAGEGLGGGPRGTGLSERLHRVGRAGQIRSRFFVRRANR